MTFTKYVELALMPQRISMLVFYNKLLFFSKKWGKSGCYVFRSGAYICYTYATNEIEETYAQLLGEVYRSGWELYVNRLNLR